MDPKMEKLMSVLGIVAAVIIAVIALFVAGKMLGLFKATPSSVSENQVNSESVTMIDVTGTSFDEAKTKLRALELEVQASYQSSASVEKDFVVSQSITAGQEIQANSVVELVVSSGEDGVTVPSVVGKSEAEAKVALESEGFIMSKDFSASDSVAKGNIISQVPAEGQSAPNGSTVAVVISSGKSTNSVIVPDIRLQTEAAAKTLLTAASLTWSTIDEAYSDTVPIGCVVSQSYSPGLTVDEGTSVNFTLSLGPETVSYKCNFNVNAPSSYQGGNAEIVLTQTGTNNVLYHSTVTGFPVSINLNNIQGQGTGVITITYTISTTVDIENEDGTISSQVKSETKAEYQNVTFTQE
jgi:serine/threonine-protein kinase